MPSSREILVTTTSAVQGIGIKQYLKPVSAHVVTGINAFNDLFGGLTDFFGGRSGTYQRQLASIYNEAIDRIKQAAYQLGADGVLGLSIDIDEISGKGKSMLMITATGTAVILDKTVEKASNTPQLSRSDSVTADQLDIFRKKKALLIQANKGSLNLTEDLWRFLIGNSLDDFYPYLMSRFPDVIGLEQTQPQIAADFLKSFTSFLDTLADDKKKELLYGSLVSESSEPVLRKIVAFIKQFNLFDADHIRRMLDHNDFTFQKRGFLALKADKTIYNEGDLREIDELMFLIQQKFPEIGQRTTKQGGFLSSKEKQVWLCACGKTNSIDSHCSGCKKDIYGFKENEGSPPEFLTYLEEKKKMLGELLG